MNADRYKVYMGAYAVSLVLFVLQIFGSLTDAVLLVSFLLSSFFLVFSFEVLPEAGTEKVQIHYYQKSRLNNYSYAMAGLFIGIAFLYYVATYLLKLNTSIFILIAWPLAALLSFGVAKLFGKTVFADIVFDYVINNLGQEVPYEQRGVIKQVVTSVVNIYEVKGLDAIANLRENPALNLTPELFNQVMALTYNYLSEYTDKLFSQEVNQLNKEATEEPQK